MKYLFATLLFALTYTALFGQATGQTGQIIVPIQMSDKLGSEALTNVDILIYPYMGDKIDMRDFKKKHKDLEDVDDWIIINSPDLSTYSEMNVMIGRVEGVPADDKAIVIWLVANYSSQNPTFFFDDNQDRDYTDNVHSKVLKRNTPYRIQVAPHNGAFNPKTVEIKLPKTKGVSRQTRGTSGPTAYKGPKEFKGRINNQFAIGIQASVGSGKNEFRFQDNDRNYPTWYSIDYTQKGIGLNASYSLKYIKLALNGTYQNHFFYTSYINEQFGEPVWRNIQGKRKLVDQVRTERNIDSHNTHHLQYSGEVALRIHLSKTTELQPFATYGFYNYSDGVYISDRHDKANKSYTLPDSKTYELGLRFEFTTGSGGRSLHIDAVMQDFDWNPQAYFDTFNMSNLEKSNRVYKLAVGYRFGL